MDPTVTIWLTSQKNPKSWNVFDNAGRVLSETAVKKWLWKDWSLPGLITSLREKRSSWCKSWISVCGHISYGVNKEQHTVHLAEKSVQNFYTVVNTAKYLFLKDLAKWNMSVKLTPLDQPRFIFHLLIISS